MVTRLKGILEIDHERGVIYFHLDEPIEHDVVTLLRICRLPKPIPPINKMMDITHMVGCDWK